MDKTKGGIKVYSKHLKHFAGKMVEVFLKHKLYGTQAIQCTLRNLIWTKEKIGLVLNNQEIYLLWKEIKRLRTDNKEIYVEGELQTIIIKLI